MGKLFSKFQNSYQISNFFNCRGGGGVIWLIKIEISEIDPPLTIMVGRVIISSPLLSMVPCAILATRVIFIFPRELTFHGLNMTLVQRT